MGNIKINIYFDTTAGERDRCNRKCCVLQCCVVHEKRNSGSFGVGRERCGCASSANWAAGVRHTCSFAFGQRTGSFLAAHTRLYRGFFDIAQNCQAAF